MTAPVLDRRLNALEELRWHVGNTLLNTMVKLSPKECVDRKLREHNPDVKIIGLQPTSEAHIVEGWKHMASANVPEVYDSIALDEIKTVSKDETKRMMDKYAKEEGFLLSPSSAANIAGAIKLAEEIDSRVVLRLSLTAFYNLKVQEEFHVDPYLQRSSYVDFQVTL